MKTTADFLDDLRAKLALPSDNKLARHLGMKRAQLGRYRGNYETFSDETSLKIARELQVEPDYIMACMAVQRAKSEATRAIWRRIAAKLAPAAAVVLLALGIAPAPAPAGSLHNQNCGTNATKLYICNNRRRRARGWRERAAQALAALARYLSIPPMLPTPEAL